MNPNDAKTIADFLLGNLEQEMATTERVFAAVPVDRQDYQPDPVSKSAIGLMRHITLEDEWLLTSVAAGAFTPPPDDSEKCGILTPAQAIAEYKARVSAAIATLRVLPGEAFAKTISFGAMTLPAVQVLSMVLRHSAHHRGQLSAYLRSMGAKVPGIYGPSADTRAAAASA